MLSTTQAQSSRAVASPSPSTRESTLCRTFWERRFHASLSAALGGMAAHLQASQARLQVERPIAGLVGHTTELVAVATALSAATTPPPASSSQGASAAATSSQAATVEHERWVQQEEQRNLMTRMQTNTQLLINPQFQLQNSIDQQLRHLPDYARGVSLRSEEDIGKGGRFLKGLLTNLGVPVGAGALVTGAVLTAEVVVVGAASILLTGGVALGVLVPLAFVGVLLARKGFQYATAYERALCKFYKAFCAIQAATEGAENYKQVLADYAAAKQAFLGELEGRGRLVRLLRRGFLQQMHFAVGHFLNGLDAEREVEKQKGNVEKQMPAREKALKAYMLACEAVEKAGADNLHLMLRVRTIAVMEAILKNRARLSFPPGDLTAALDKEVVLIESHFSLAFKDLLFHLQQRMVHFTAFFLRGGKPSLDEAQELNALLRLESLSVFEKLNKPYGDFMALVATFFRASIMSFLYGNDEQAADLIQKETYERLYDQRYTNTVIQVLAPNKARFTLAAQQFHKLLLAIESYREKYRSELPAQTDDALQKALAYMEQVAVEFVAAHGQAGLANDAALREAMTYIRLENHAALQALQATYEKAGNKQLITLETVNRECLFTVASYEELLLAILNPANERMYQLVEQSSAESRFVAAIASIPPEVFTAVSHRLGQSLNVERVTQLFRSRVLLRRFQKECGVSLDSIGRWLEEISNPHSTVVRDVVRRDVGGKLLKFIPEFKRLGLVRTDVEIARLEKQVKCLVFLVQFERQFELRYETVENCVLSLADENSQAAEAILRVPAQRDELLRLFESVASFVADDFKETLARAIPLLKMRALCINLNKQFKTHFVRLVDWVAAIIALDHPDILQILKHTEQMTLLLSNLAEIDRQMGRRVQNTLTACIQFSAAWASVFVYFEEQHQVTFTTINACLDAIFNPQDERIKQVLRRAGRELIDKLTAMPSVDISVGMLEGRRLAAIQFLEDALFLIKLNDHFAADFSTLSVWSDALLSPQHTVIERILQERASELLALLAACPENVTGSNRLKLAGEKVVERCLLVNLQTDCGLTFENFNEAMRVLQCVALNASTATPLPALNNPARLLAWLAAFPQAHPKKAQCCLAETGVKTRLQVEAFNCLLAPRQCIDLNACYAVFSEVMDAAMHLKQAELSSWIAALTEKLGIEASEVTRLQLALKKQVFLFELNAFFQSERQCQGLPAIPVLNALSDLVVDGHNCLPANVLRIVSHHLGRAFHEKLARLPDLGVSRAVVENTRHQLMQAILLHELRNKFLWQGESLIQIFEWILRDRSSLSPLFTQGLGDAFVAWIKAMPATSIPVELRRRATEAVENQIFVFKFNQSFSFNFNSLGACLSALRDARNDRMRALIQARGKEVISLLESLPEFSADEVGEKKALVGSLKKRLLAYKSQEKLDELTREFAVRFDDDMDNTLICLSEKFASHEANEIQTVSVTTGKTLLHWLAELEEGVAVQENVHRVARSLLPLRYFRDHQNQTAEVLLKHHDPFHLNAFLKKETPVANAAQLARIDDFLARVRRDITAAAAVEETERADQFILLEGPPGTGKTTAVIQYLAHRTDCEVTVWQQGNTDQSLVGQAERKVENFFREADARANQEGNQEKLQILFIDEINGVCPALQGEARAGYHDQGKIVNLFQTCTSALKGKQVVLVGATNFPNKIAKPMLERAQGGRILFPLPNIAEREQILTHLFRRNIFSVTSVKKLAEITTGWSPRQLVGIVNELPANTVVVEEVMVREAFARASRANEQAFKEKHRQVNLHLAAFETEIVKDPLGHLSDTHQHLAGCFKDVMLCLRHPESFPDARIHVLLHGEAGGGKTYAIRQLLERINLPYFVVKGAISADELEEVFAYASQFKPALIFFDEMDAICRIEGIRECLQTHMEGIEKNSVVVLGATNFPDRLPDAVLDRFIKVEVSPLSVEDKQKLLAKVIRSFLQPPFCLTSAPCLTQALAENCSVIAEAMDDLSVRSTVRALTLGLGRLDALAKEEAAARGGAHPEVAVRLVQVLTCLFEARESILRVKESQGAAALSEVSRQTSSLERLERSKARLLQQFGLYRGESRVQVATAAAALH